MCEVGECTQGPHNTLSIVLGVAFPDYANICKSIDECL